MALELTPQLEDAIITIAQKIRGSRGGKSMTAKKLRALKRNSKLARQAKKAA